jgi:hypothetical protein
VGGNLYLTLGDGGHGTGMAKTNDKRTGRKTVEDKMKYFFFKSRIPHADVKRRFLHLHIYVAETGQLASEIE